MSIISTNWPKVSLGPGEQFVDYFLLKRRKDKIETDINRLVSMTAEHNFEIWLFSSFKLFYDFQTQVCQLSILNTQERNTNLIHWARTD